MNDPGVDEPISNAADNLEDDPYIAEQKQKEKEEQDFLDPSRWWFASTAIPLIAGTFGPIANAFSICALVQSWRSYIPEGKTENLAERIEDPRWLIAINAVSLAFALIANISLLLNMARRLPFPIAQPITIIGWMISGVLLIALVVVANTSVFRFDPPERHSLTQAYYYAIMAAGQYMIISMLMTLTVFGAIRHHYPKEFRLTMSQRTLMLQTIAFMVYLLVGALIFSKIEGWLYLDAVYWADFTLLTVGLGTDFSPKTHAGRSILFPYAIGGIVTVGLVVGSIRSLLLERGKHKMQARITEKTREQAVRHVDRGRRTISLGLFQTYHFDQVGLTELQRREQEFHLMRKIQRSAQLRRRWIALAFSSAAALLLWFVGAAVFHQAEHRDQGWTYFGSLYFAYTSLLTIGYGDFYPASNAGKPVFVFWTLLAVPTLTILISNMGDTVVKGVSDFTIWLGAITLRLLLRDVDASPPRQYTYPEWTYYLHLLGQHEWDPTQHRAPPVSPLPRDVPQVGLAGGRLAGLGRQVIKTARGMGPHHPSSPPTTNGKGEEEDESADTEHERLKWSWLGTRSPLMGNKSEAEWILERMSRCLEREMAWRDDPGGRPGWEPPVSVEALRRVEEGGDGDDKEDGVM
ncbi:voltage-gated potassium channel [Eremomyces bilateralis CBS 781.70]|uniref:Voltage-gated potassium channel n=1 Tax=Eremomyces bilateralis CBS 781.70 TaxID=1392243 RepID=A0A6G1FYZ4_9PEZI|nr:voltage-gated potassium channel [Eremomyces bilateralis CBS 781.70]KAF1810942.1 voltage-gated potassium channel [Eremomyces bilateralis CBS 781.70]